MTHALTLSLSLELTPRTLIVHLWRNQIVDYGTCPGFMSIKMIAEKICKSETTTRRAMRELTSEGGIETKVEGRTTLYRVIIEDGNGNEYLSTRNENNGS